MGLSISRLRIGVGWASMYPLWHDTLEGVGVWSVEVCHDLFRRGAFLVAMSIEVSLLLEVVFASVVALVSNTSPSFVLPRSCIVGWPFPPLAFDSGSGCRGDTVLL